MAAIIVALTSIAGLTALTWWLNERALLPVKICAICAGTAGTWIWILAALLADSLSFAAYMPVVAILMGGSVVGIAYQAEKYLKSGRSPLLWKALFISVGFGTVWSITHFAFGFVILGVLALTAIAGFFLELPLRGVSEDRAARLEREMEHCC